MKITLPTEPLVRALRRVALLSAERSRAIKLELSSGQLQISSSNPDLGEASEEVDVDYDGDTISMGFNAKYLLEGITALGCKEMWLSLRDGNAPAEIRPTDDEDSLRRRDADEALTRRIQEHVPPRATAFLVVPQLSGKQALFASVRVPKPFR